MSNTVQALQPDAVPLPPTDLPWLQSQWSQLRQRFTDSQQAAPHALMLVGSAGSGRHATASHLASWLLCQQPGAEAACGECRSCRMLEAGSHPDLLNLALEEDSSSIKIEQIRSLINALNLTAGFNGWRIAIIEHAASMTDNAANALLKTLEEPGARTLLLLLVDTRKALPATIYSRCQQWPLAAPDEDAAMHWLQQHCQHDAASLKLALELAHGAPLQAWSMLHDNSVAEAVSINDGLAALAAGDADVATVLAQWQAIPAERCWHWLQHHLHRCCRSLLLASAAEPVALQACWQLYAEAGKSLALAATGLRQDLQLQAWLLQWRLLCASHAMIGDFVKQQVGTGQAGTGGRQA